MVKVKKAAACLMRLRSSLRHIDPSGFVALTKQECVC